MSVVLQFPRAEQAQPVDESQPACADKNPDWWFDEAQYGRGKRVCRDCPMREPCLAQALGSGEPLGVWGGLTPAERAALPDAVVVPLRPRRW